MILNDKLFNDNLLKSMPYSSEWINSYSFTFLAGTTVSVTPILDKIVPLGTTLEIFAGETVDTLVQVYDGLKSPVLFIGPVSGASNLYIKIKMASNQAGLTPEVKSLSIVIAQESSLYTIATQILSDGLLQSNSKWLVDTELQKYRIPFAWFKPIKHRTALAQVAEACGGVAYQDRHGVVHVQAGNYLQRTGHGVKLFDINDDRIIDASSLISEIRNSVQITTFPYEALPDQLVWETSGSANIELGEVVEFKITYSDFDAVTDAVITATGFCTITESELFSWGAYIKVTGTGSGAYGVSVNGKPLVVKGAQVVEEVDGESIRINGDKTLAIDKNYLIQSRELAETIAEDIISVTSSARRDIDMTWRGDPTLELGDNGLLNGQNGVIVSQEIIFNGFLSTKTLFRRVN